MVQEQDRKIHDEHGSAQPTREAQLRKEPSFPFSSTRTARAEQLKTGRGSVWVHGRNQTKDNEQQNHLGCKSLSCEIQEQKTKPSFEDLSTESY
jgi:hypothetical protein